MIAFSIIITNSDFITKIGEAKAFDDVEDSRKLIFYGLIVFAVVTMLVGLCGCCFKCCKNRCFAVMYGIILFPTWLIVIILGGLAAGASVASGDVVEEKCTEIAQRLTVSIGEDGNVSVSSVGTETDSGVVDAGFTIESEEERNAREAGVLNSKQAQYYPTAITVAGGTQGLGLFEPQGAYATADLQISLDIYENIFVNQEMCTRNCPCPKNAKSGEWDILDAATRATYKRSANFVFTDNVGVKTYTSYDDCITNVKDGSLPENMSQGYTGTKAFFEFAKGFREQGDFTDIKEWIEFFEKEYECAGICTKALFNWIEPVSEGIPTKSCVSSIKDDLTGAFMGLGICTLISGFILFFIFLFNYCMWKKY